MQMLNKTIIFKKIIALLSVYTMILSNTVSVAYAQDIMNDSFFEGNFKSRSSKNFKSAKDLNTTAFDKDSFFKPLKTQSPVKRPVEKRIVSKKPNRMGQNYTPDFTNTLIEQSAKNKSQQIKGKGFKEVPINQVVRMKTNETKLIEFDKDIYMTYVTNPNTLGLKRLEDDPRKMFIIGRKPGVVTLYALDEQLNPVLTALVSVGLINEEVEKLNRQLSERFPGSENLKVTVNKNALVVSGTVANALLAKEIIDVVNSFLPNVTNASAMPTTTGNTATANTGAKTQAPAAASAGLVNNTTPSVVVLNQLKIRNHAQVNIRVRFAEMDRSLIKNLGFKVSPMHLKPNAAGVMTATAGWGYRITKALKATYTFDYLDGMLNIGEQHGLVNMLSEPNVTTVSGKSASISVGGAVPQVAAGGVNGTTSISSVGYGVNLSITPVVLSDNLISLSLAPSVTSLDGTNAYSANGTTAVATKNRSASTTVELASGQSFAIAGLIEERNVGGVTKEVPILADIPIIGALFRSKSYSKKQTELVIIVTAFIVEPDSYNQIATPIDGGRMQFSWLSLILDSGNSLVPQSNTGKVREIQKRERFEGENGFYY